MYIMNLAFQLFLTIKGGTFWPDILDNQQIPKLTSKPAAETFIEIKLYKWMCISFLLIYENKQLPI